MTSEEAGNVFLFGAEERRKLMQEAALHKRLVAVLIRKHDTENKEALFQVLCECYVCNHGIGEMLSFLKENNPTHYNEKKKSFDLLITEEEGAALRTLLGTADVLKSDLEVYNITLALH